MSETVAVLGAGLAGTEAAYQIAKRGVPVRLYEMKPAKMTPAHHSPGFAELCCSNSFRSDALTNAVGLLKEEMRRMDSLILRAADATRVPAGSALAVDRALFSEYITGEITKTPNIEVVSEEVTKLPAGGVCVVATGPLTADALAAEIAALAGGEGLHFFDAVAPIVEFAGIDMEVAYFASRYGKGEPTDYINCPLTREEYEAFYRELTTARTAELKDFEKKIKVFEGCMPVEEMARRGFETLCYGPMKPVGLPDPRTGREPFAV